MIGRPDWFSRRKYGGWGIFPKTWQGWVYLLVVIGIVISMQYLPVDETTKMITMIVIAAVFVLDTLDMMRKVPMDERERNHEAIAERNALWVIITVLAGGILYQGVMSSMEGEVYIDPVIIVAILAGVVAKAISNIYLDRKN
jgi:membrane protein DedA with SNARE-associated domain